jgi:uncharacterized protein (TIRG00374 family)
LLVLVLRLVNWRDFAALIRAARLNLALAASLAVPCLVGLLALRWSIFLRQQSIRIPFDRVLLLTWAGQFFNSILPGSTGGDVFKIYQACRDVPERKSAAAASVIVDRIVALLALLILACVGIGTGIPRELVALISWPHFSTWWWSALIVLVLAATWVGWRILSNGRARDFLNRVVATLRLALRPSPTLAVGLLLAVTIHLLSILSFFLFARSLGIGIGLAQVLVVVPSILLLALIPVTVNGHGIREVMLVYYFTQLNLSASTVPGASTVETVIALSALVVTNDLLWSGMGGLAYLMLGRRSTAPAVAIS